MEGENMQSVKKNRRTLVEQRWHCSSGGAEQLCVDHKWSAGVNPTVFQETFQGGGGKAQTDEDGYRRYGYKDPALQILRTRTRFWRRTTGGVRTRRRRRRRRRRSNNILFIQ
jgi:hypothetical protein